MTQSTMRGARVKAVRCHVEGHPYCEVAKEGEPPVRSTEKRSWRTEVEDELHGEDPPEQWEPPVPFGQCERCGMNLYWPSDADKTHYFIDGGTYCNGCIGIVEVTYQDILVDLSDPMISVRRG